MKRTTGDRYAILTNPHYGVPTLVTNGNDLDELLREIKDCHPDVEHVLCEVHGGWTEGGLPLNTSVLLTFTVEEPDDRYVTPA